MAWIEQLRFDERGLVPVIAQEALTGEVLMLAYADRAALERTRETGFAHYWSRSRGELWQKGGTSGNVQEVVEVRADCDGDGVLYLVRQTGPACHTLEGSCFHRRVDGDDLAPAGAAQQILGRVDDVVRERFRARPDGSYTTYLFEQGIDKILKKLGEETTELVIAAKNLEAERGSAADLSGEAADLLFHLVVLLRERGVPLASVWEVLESRFGSAPRELGRAHQVTPTDPAIS